MVSDDDIRRVLTEAKTIALVGYSANPDRPSHRVAHFLKAQGHRVIPVNPGLAGQTALGETIYASVSDIPDAVDMIDIFRQSSAVLPIVEASLLHFRNLKSVWMQLGVANEEAANLARAKGATVIENRCPAIEYPRLGMIS